MKILITGAAGFIGHALLKELVKNPINEVVGLDCLNDYYNPKLKLERLEDCGILSNDIEQGGIIYSKCFANFKFVKSDLTDKDYLKKLFLEYHFTHVINLGGQAGVRYSIENPDSYIQSNVVGFLNILECCRNYHVEHLVYASSSSTYGQGSHVPFNEDDDTDHPVSLYAATKKSNELMAYAYSKLFGFQTTGLRFFTVYGPWGRPDMAPYKFMDAICNNRPIQVYNHGNMLRDFTYIDDIVDGILRVINNKNTASIPAEIYNIGCSHPIKLMDFIETIERVTGRKASKEMLGMQPGDVTRTYADVSKIHAQLGYQPHVSLEMGISKLYEWYKTHHNY